MQKRLVFRAIAVSMMLTGGSYLPVFADSPKNIAGTPDEIFRQQQTFCREDRGSNIGIKACIWLEYQAADRKLNEVYKRLIAKASPEERSLLAEAQLGWIQVRDKTCEFEVYRNRGGTGYSGFLNGCKARITSQRRVELERYLKD
jgi:uncharacterized protein YecT (DUF1311 family)